MSEFEVNRIDLVKIETDARRLRAEATGQVIAALVAWFRKPRTTHAGVKSGMKVGTA